MIGKLPTSLTVNGTDYEIRTDFRDVLNVICAFSDTELEEKEKMYVCLCVLYLDFEAIPESDYEEAFKEALRFIDYGMSDRQNRDNSPHVMDWEQDESILFPAVNKVAGFETRSVEYLHWWTFVGYYMEISDGLFSQVVGLRMKKAKHKKFEKWEREFWAANKHLCIIKPKLSADEQAQKDKLNKMLG